MKEEYIDFWSRCVTESIFWLTPYIIIFIILVLFLIDMNEVAILLQVFVALVVFNVWTFGAEKPTKYRGGSAKTLREEFMEFGLSKKSI